MKLDSMNQGDITVVLNGMIVTAYYRAHMARLQPQHRELTLRDVAHEFQKLVENIDKE